MSVALDANATAMTAGSGVQTLDNANLTVGAGANMVLVAQLTLSVLTVSGVSVVWDPGGANQSLTLIKSANGGSGDRAELWGLVAPVSGNKILRATWTTVANAQLNGTSFSGVDQTGGATTFPNATSATAVSGNPALTVMSAAGDVAIDCVAPRLLPPSSPLQTQLCAASRIGSSYAAGSASVGFGWTIPSGDWVEVGCDILAAASQLDVAQAAQTQSGGIVGTNWSRS
jgi:hypothetical protein